MSDKEIALIEKGSNGPVDFPDQDYDLIGRQYACCEYAFSDCSENSEDGIWSES